MRTVAEANKYLSDQAPWKLRESDPERMRTILHVALQLVDDGKTLLTPFLPRSSRRCTRCSAGRARGPGRRGSSEVDEEGGPPYPVITGDYDSRRPVGGAPVRPGTPLAAPVPLFAKLDPSVVDEELARLEHVTAAAAPPPGDPPRPPAAARAAAGPGVRQPLPPGDDRRARWPR